MRNKILLVLSTLFTIGISAYLVKNLDWPTIILTFKSLNWGWFGGALLAYFVSLWLRATRFKQLLYSSDTPAILLLPISSLHNMFNYLLPARSGELSYILLSNKKLNIPLSEGTTTLLASRFFDLAIVAILLVGVLPFFAQELPLWVLKTVVLYCLLVLLAFGTALYLTRKPIYPLKKGENNNLIGKIKVIFTKVLFGIREIREKKSALRVAANTFGIWLSLYANFYFITLGLGYHVSYIQVILISLVMVPLSTLPLQGFANMGTHELGWVTILMIFGYSYQTALSIAVGSHLLLASSILFFGILSGLIINQPFFQKWIGALRADNTN